jgi:four helix bundle protein
MVERKNINRGYKKLELWSEAINLYVLSSKIFSKFSYDLKRSSSNASDAALSISRNIAEGYCRRSLKEYLNYLNFSLGSCGEFHSSYIAFYSAGQITLEEFEQLDQLHFKVENYLIRLILSLQKKQKDGVWEDSFAQ